MEAIKDETKLEDDVSIGNEEPIEVELKTDEKEQTLSKREQAMQAIVAQREDDLSNNDGEPAVERDFQQVAASQQDDQEENKPEEEPEEPVKTESPVYQNESGEFVMKMKVNGKEVEKTLEQIKATAQKHESADIRLQQASERERQIQAYEQQIRQQQAEIEAQLNSVKAEGQLSQQDAGHTDDLKSVIENIYDGETDQAVETLERLLKGRQEPTLDPNQLASMAKEQALAEMREEVRQRDYQASLDNGMKWLQEKHSNVLEDENLRSIVDSQTAVIMQREPTLTPEQVIRKATEMVLTVSSKGNGASDRESSKSQLQSHPKRQASKRYSPPKEPVIDNSPAAVIAREKARRGKIANRRSV